MTMFKMIALIFLGGGLGSVTRFSVGKLAISFFSTTKFPIGTLIANFLACLVLGITVYLLKDKMLEHEWVKYFLVIGFCGGFSTFSTFSYDTLKLMNEGLVLMAVLNIITSLILGIVTLWILTKQI